MANFINKYQNQSAYDADSTKQYPNTSLVGTDVVFKMSDEPEPVAFGGLTVKYNVTQVEAQSEVTLFKGGGGSSTSSSSSESGGGGVMPTKMYVDGNEETPINTWRFETAGEHTVQFEFADNVVPQSFLEDPGTVSTVTEAIVGTDITGIGSAGFSNTKLTSVTCLSTTPPTIADTSSLGGDYPIYVPAESVATYKAASTSWSNLETRIQAIQ